MKLSMKMIAIILAILIMLILCYKIGIYILQKLGELGIISTSPF